MAKLEESKNPGDPAARPALVGEGDLGILTDLYELTMLQAYHRLEMDGEAVFSLYFRKLPAGRNLMIACGIEETLRIVRSLRFDETSIRYLRDLGDFDDEFLEWLSDFRFSGEVSSVPEGTPVFPGEPILEVVGPLAEAQLLESLVMNQICFQTVLASKAFRIVTAAGATPVVDFGLRRMHGMDASIKAAWAFHVAGVSATSNVLAGRLWEIPVTGTMAHSYVQAHDDELESFRHFAGIYPETVLLVDTYDTLEGVRKVVDLARELGEDFRVRAIRIDSGDLADLARKSRAILDESGLDDVGIFLSGGLDEYRIAEIEEAGVPVDGYGVGTKMGVSADAPAVDMAYKLTAYGGRGRMKTSPGKRILPGRKQVFRRETDGPATGDVIGRWNEEIDGRPLLEVVYEGGEILPAGSRGIEAARKRRRDEVARLPGRLRGLAPAVPPYPVAPSDSLATHQERVEERVSGSS